VRVEQVRRLKDGIEQLLAVGNLEQARWRLKEKALIQQYRSAKR
jgi:hypothetical protein